MAVDRSPDGPAMGQPLGATQDSVALSLGSTVDFPDLLWPDPVDPSFLQPGGHGRGGVPHGLKRRQIRSEEHTSELQSLMRISYAVFCLKKKNNRKHMNISSTRSP